MTVPSQEPEIYALSRGDSGSSRLVCEPMRLTCKPLRLVFDPRGVILSLTSLISINVSK